MTHNLRLVDMTGRLLLTETITSRGSSDLRLFDMAGGRLVLTGTVNRHSSITISRGDNRLILVFDAICLLRHTPFAVSYTHLRAHET